MKINIVKFSLVFMSITTVLTIAMGGLVVKSQKDLQKLQGKSLSLEEVIAEQSNEIKDYKSTIEEYRGNITDLEAQIDTLLKQAEQQEKEIDTVTNQNKGLQREVDSLEGVRLRLLDNIGYIPTASEMDLFYRVVECEAGNQSLEGRIAVANVIINRVKSSKFPNTLSGVLNQKNQFTPVLTGWVHTKTASSKSKQAVDEALKGRKVVGSNILYFWALWADLPYTPQIIIGDTGFSSTWN